MSLTLPIDTVVTLEPGLPVTDVGELLCQSISEQLVAMETCLCQFAKVLYNHKVHVQIFHT